MLLLGSPHALDKFQTGSKGSLVLGTDFKVTAISDLGLGSTENAGNLSGSDAVSLSLADGLMVDWSLVGMSAHTCSVGFAPVVWPVDMLCYLYSTCIESTGVHLHIVKHAIKDYCYLWYAVMAAWSK